MYLVHINRTQDNARDRVYFIPENQVADSDPLLQDLLSEFSCSRMSLLRQKSWVAIFLDGVDWVAHPKAKKELLRKDAQGVLLAARSVLKTDGEGVPRFEDLRNLYWRIFVVRHVLQSVTKPPHVSEQAGQSEYYTGLISLKRRRPTRRMLKSRFRYLHFVQGLVSVLIPHELEVVGRRWTSLTHRQHADFGQNFLGANIVLLESPDQTSTAAVIRAENRALHARHTLCAVWCEQSRRKSHIPFAHFATSSPSSSSGDESDSSSGDESGEEVPPASDSESEAGGTSSPAFGGLSHRGPIVNWRADVVAPTLAGKSGSVADHVAHDLIVRAASSPQLSWYAVFSKTPTHNDVDVGGSPVSGASAEVLGKAFPFLYSEEEVPLLCDLWERIESHGIELSLPVALPIGVESSVAYGFELPLRERRPFGVYYVNRFFAKRLSQIVSSIFVWLRSHDRAKAPAALVEKLLDIEDNLGVHSDYASIENIRSFVWVDLVGWVRTQHPVEDVEKVQRLVVSSALWPSKDTFISEDEKEARRKNKQEAEARVQKRKQAAAKEAARAKAVDYCLRFNHGRFPTRFGVDGKPIYGNGDPIYRPSESSSLQTAEMQWLDRLCDFGEDFAHGSTPALCCPVGPTVLRRLWLHSQSVLIQSIRRGRTTSIDGDLKTPGKRWLEDLECDIRRKWRKAPLVSRTEMHHRLWSFLCHFMTFDCYHPSWQLRIPFDCHILQAGQSWEQKLLACEDGTPADYVHTLWEARILWFQCVSVFFGNRRDNRRLQRKQMLFRDPSGPTQTPTQSLGLRPERNSTSTEFGQGLFFSKKDPQLQRRRDEDSQGRRGRRRPRKPKKTPDYYLLSPKKTSVFLTPSRSAIYCSSCMYPSTPTAREQYRKRTKIGEGALFESHAGCSKCGGHGFNMCPSRAENTQSKPILAKRDVSVGTDLDRAQTDQGSQEEEWIVSLTTNVDPTRAKSACLRTVVETRDAGTQLDFVFVKNIDGCSLFRSLCPLVDSSLRLRLELVVWSGGGSSAGGGFDCQVSWSKTKVPRDDVREPRTLQSVLRKVRNEKETGKNVDNGEAVLCEVADCVVRCRLDFLNTRVSPSGVGSCPRALFFSGEQSGGLSSEGPSGGVVDDVWDVGHDEEEVVWTKDPRTSLGQRDDPRGRVSLLSKAHQSTPKEMHEDDLTRKAQKPMRDALREALMVKPGVHRDDDVDFFGPTREHLATSFSRNPSPFCFSRFASKLFSAEAFADLLHRADASMEVHRPDPGTTSPPEQVAEEEVWQEVGGRNIDGRVQRKRNRRKKGQSWKGLPFIGCLVDSSGHVRRFLPPNTGAGRETAGHWRQEEGPQQRRQENIEVESVINQGGGDASTSATDAEISDSTSDHPWCLKCSRRTYGAETSTRPVRDGPASSHLPVGVCRGASKGVETSFHGSAASSADMELQEGEETRTAVPVSTDSDHCPPFDPVSAMKSDSKKLVDYLFGGEMPALVTEAVAVYAKLLIELFTEFMRLHPVCAQGRQFETPVCVLPGKHFVGGVVDEDYDVSLMFEDFFERASSEGLSLTFRPGKICDDFRRFVWERCHIVRNGPSENRNGMSEEDRDQDQSDVSKSDSQDRRTHEAVDADFPRCGDDGHPIRSEGARWMLDDGTTAATWIEDPEKFSLMFFDSLFNASPLVLPYGPSMEYTVVEISEAARHVGLTRTGAERLAKAIHNIRLAARCPLGCAQISPAPDAIIHAKCDGGLGCQAILCASCWNRVQAEATATSTAAKCPFCRATVQAGDMQPQALFRRVSAQTQRLHYLCLHCEHRFNLACLADCDRTSEVVVGSHPFSFTTIDMFPLLLGGGLRVSARNPFVELESILFWKISIPALRVCGPREDSSSDHVLKP